MTVPLGASRAAIDLLGSVRDKRAEIKDCGFRRLTANYLIWLFVQPSHLLFLIALVGVGFWRTRIARRCRGIAAVLIVVFGLSPASAILLRPLESRFEKPTSLDAVDGIIVLAGSELRKLSQVYDQPQLNSMGDRLTTFLMLAEKYPAARLVHSGQNDDGSRALILGTGIDGQRVIFEDQSRNTCESARVAREVVTPGPTEMWLVVTSAFHVPRAVACFRAIGWEIVPYPADYRTGPNPFSFDLSGNLENVDLAAHEWLGLLYHRLKGVTRELFPAPGDRASAPGR